jgi:hypothetical protein
MPAWTQDQIRETNAGKAFLDAESASRRVETLKTAPPAPTVAPHKALTPQAVPKYPKTPERPTLAHVAPRPFSVEAKLNRTEKAWLAIMRARGYQKIRIQSHTIRLGDACRLTPDFSYVRDDGALVFFEIKGGFIREDSIIKLRIAAREYNEYVFVLAQRKRGTWTETVVEP